MVGRRVMLRIEKGAARIRARSSLEARNLVVRDDRGVVRVDGVSFDLRAGEIVGIAGVAGNGQSELLEAIAGIRPLAGGEILVDGEPLPPAEHNPAFRAGHRPRPCAGGPPSGRPRHAVRGVRERHARLPRRAGLWQRASSTTARRSAPTPSARWRPTTCGPRAPLLKTANFSGGNQQKIVLAREIERDPKIMLVGQPTRGVDIGAIEFIHKRIVAMRDAGKAILLVSVELDEIFALTDRILVMCAGRVIGERRPGGDQGPGARPADGRRQRARRMSTPLKPLPAWADVALIPLINVAAAFVVSGFVVLAIGENPLEAVQILINGALGNREGIGFTLYYATSFIFTGLAVAVCFHAGLFNIGVEGQAYIAGLGAALAALHLGLLPGYSLAAAAIVAAALFGAAFAAIPGYLQANRGSHIVITTIMFNFIASAIMGYLLVDVLRVPGQMNAETRRFPERAGVPQLHEIIGHVRRPLAGDAAQPLVPAGAGLPRSPSGC